MALTGGGMRVASELCGQLKNGWRIDMVSDDQIALSKGEFGIYFDNQAQVKAFLIGLECAYMDMEGKMEQRLETITQHVFAFDDDEISIILNALAENGDDDLYAYIWGELPHDQYEDNPF